MSQIRAQGVIFEMFYMLSESVRDISMTSPQLLANLEIAEFCDRTRKQLFLQKMDTNSEKINYCYPTITQLIKRYCSIL